MNKTLGTSFPVLSILSEKTFLQLDAGRKQVSTIYADRLYVSIDKKIYGSAWEGTLEVTYIFAIEPGSTHLARSQSSLGPYYVPYRAI